MRKQGTWARLQSTGVMTKMAAKTGQRKAGEMFEHSFTHMQGTE